MKNLTLSLILFATGLTLVGQSLQSLPTDEYGRISFTEVIQVEGASSDELLNNATNYLESLMDDHKKLKKGPYLNEENSEVTLPLVFTVYRDFPVHSPHGHIKYNLTVSTKDGRYRYLATDFTFHYLERNRYGKFIEVKGKSKILEDPVFKGNQKLWEQHKETTAQKILEVTERLRVEMLFIPSKTESEIVKVKVNEEW